MADLGSNPCGICGHSRSRRVPSSVGGFALHLCFFCRDVEHALRQSGSWPDLPLCRHLLAGDFEREAMSLGLFEPEILSMWRRRMAARFSSGDLRKECSCATCRKLASEGFMPDGLDLTSVRDTKDANFDWVDCDGATRGRMAFAGLPTGKVFDAAGRFVRGEVDLQRLAFGVSGDLDRMPAGTAGDEISIRALRSMKGSAVIERRDGSLTTALDEVKRRMIANCKETLRGPVSAFTESVMPSGPSGMSDAEKRADIVRAKRFWRGVSLFGEGGYLHQNGVDYVDTDGVCHEVPSDE